MGLSTKMPPKPAGETQEGNAKEGAAQDGNSNDPKKKQGTSIPYGRIGVLGTISAKVSSVFSVFRLVREGLSSENPKVRRMSVFFFVSFFGLLVVTAAGGLRLKVVLDRLKADLTRPKRLSFAEKRRLEEQAILAKKNLGYKIYSPVVNVGEFSVELSKGEKKGESSNQLNLLELEIVLECDTADAGGVIEENKTEVRSQLTSVLLGMKADEVLTRDGKGMIRALIIERMNQWLPHGKVIRVYFSKFLASRV
jgi:flagellar basal body-associated protein FliL